MSKESRLRLLGMLCPFHYRYLEKVGNKWVCPIENCPYQRITCPHCGWIIRIVPDVSVCLRCKQKFSFKEVVSLYTKAFNITYERALGEVVEIMRRYQ